MAYIIRGVYYCTSCTRDAMAAERERSPGVYYGVPVTPEDIEAEYYRGPIEECTACTRRRR